MSVFVSVHLPDTHYFPLNNSDFAIAAVGHFEFFFRVFYLFWFLVF